MIYTHGILMKRYLHILFFASICLLGCAQLDDPLPSRDVKATPAMQFEDTTVLEMHEGTNLSWRMKTLYLEQWNGSNRIFSKPVLVDLFDSTGERLAWLEADSASMDGQLTFINAHGNVKARSPDGATVLADSLIWDKKSNMVRTNSKVKVISEEGDVLTGVGFQSDSRLQEWKILSQVRAILQDMDKRGQSFE